jgi:hypothetical protein
MKSQVVLARTPDSWPLVVVQFRVHVHVHVIIVHQMFLQCRQSAKRRCFAASEPAPKNNHSEIIFASRIMSFWGKKTHLFQGNALLCIYKTNKFRNNFSNMYVLKNSISEL